jgi:acyl-CoA thioesterase-1
MRGSDIEIAGAARRAFAVHCSALVLGAALGVLSPARAAAPPVKLLVVGDSLSAEYGLPRGSGWVALLQEKLAQERPNVSVINASISGDTTSGGRSRLPALLSLHHPRIVVLELGGNDALRGLPLAMTQANLKDMARMAKASGAKVVIVGIAVPPNYGRKYADEFVGLFGTVARAEGASLVPFLLAGVADVPQAQEQFQADGIHPKAQAHPRMLANVWPVLKPLLSN